MDSILRKSQRTQYTSIDNGLLGEKQLSFLSRGIAAHLLSKPDDWKINMRYLHDASPDSQRNIASAIKELAYYGYLKRERKNDGKGRISTYTWIADYPAFINDGTPESRLKGYDVDSKTTDTAPPDVSVHSGTYLDLKTNTTTSEDTLHDQDLPSSKDPSRSTKMVRSEAAPPDSPQTDTEQHVDETDNNEPHQDALFDDVNAEPTDTSAENPTNSTAQQPNADQANVPPGHYAKKEEERVERRIPVNHVEWDELVKNSSNPVATLRYMIKILYPEVDLPSFSRIGALSSTLGSRVVCEELWKHGARGLKGDPISYIHAVKAVNKRQKGSSKQVDPKENTVSMAALFEGE